MTVLINDPNNKIDVMTYEMDYDNILLSIKNLSDFPNSKIKIYSNKPPNYVLSITSCDIKTWKIDYPIKLREVHKQCYATKDQSIAIFRELSEVGHIDDIPGFIEVPISEFTLDEMLEFKKEEEMMLRRENPHANTNIPPSINEPSSNTVEAKPPIQTEKITQVVEKEIKKTIQKKPINKDTLDSLFEI